jgi:redox-sensitive bicupin YhaK (pirin superfamily)
VQEERTPAFLHYPADDIPRLDVDGITVRVIIGEAYGQTSPVMTYSPTLYLECRMPEGLELVLPEQYRERAAYVVSGAVDIDQHTYTSGIMAVACSDKRIRLTAREESHVMVIGGEPLGERHIWWNFVSSSKDRIEKAKADWKNGRFGTVPGDDEFIPLPD